DVDFEDDDTSGLKRLVHRAGRRTVILPAVDLSIFQQFARSKPTLELLDRYELIVDPVDLVVAAGARGQRDAQERVKPLRELLADGRLSDPAGPADDEKASCHGVSA